MRVTILYFAAARERAGTSSDALELAEGATAGDALAAACARHPPLQAVASRLRLAVDQEFAGADRKLRDGSEVAGADCGAVVGFVGTVRATNHGKRVVRLEYEAYPEMALRIFDHIAAEARAKWSARVAIHHRVGSLEPGEISVAIAAAAPHRGDAFEACRHAIEALKKDAPIWKRELYPDGSSWVGLGSLCMLRSLCAWQSRSGSPVTSAFARPSQRRWAATTR